jgi:hypothetical protein
MFFTMGPRRQLDAGPLFAMQMIAGLQRGDLPAGRRGAALFEDEEWGPARRVKQWLWGGRGGRQSA